MLVVGGAVRRQADPSRRPVEQANAKQGFEILDDGRHRRPRQAEHVGGTGKTVGIHHPGEHLHGLKTVHRTISWRAGLFALAE